MCTIPGDTPFLVAGPVMEAMGLFIDLGAQMLKWPIMEWQPPERGITGNYEPDMSITNSRHEDTNFDLWPDDFTIRRDICPHNLAARGVSFRPIVPDTTESISLPSLSPP